jgi:hypothetical protein
VPPALLLLLWWDVRARRLQWLHCCCLSRMGGAEYSL